MSSRPLIAPVLAFVLLVASVPRARCADADADGIPQDWENLRGLDDNDPSDAALDFDHDGLSNLAEYCAAGRPWGNYRYSRFPLDQVPSGAPVTSADFACWNREGEALIRFNDSAGQLHLRLWTSRTAAESADPAVVTLANPSGAPLAMNDHGKLLMDLQDGSNAEVRDVRAWASAPLQFSYLWSDDHLTNGYEDEVLSLGNDGNVLLRASSWELVSDPPFGTFLAVMDNYVWGTPVTAGPVPVTSDILAFAHDPVLMDYIVTRAVDPAAGAALASNVRHYAPPNNWPSTTFFSLPTSGTSTEISPGPRADDWHTFVSGCAGGHWSGNMVWQDGQITGFAWVNETFSDLSGSLTGTNPEAREVSDDGTVLGTTDDTGSGSTIEGFLWNQRPGLLRKARPDADGMTLGASRLTADGDVLTLDWDYDADPGTPAPDPPAFGLPIIFRRITDTIRDGLQDENLSDTSDADGDGLLDSRESAAGTSSSLQDSDGDGVADLAELVLDRNPAQAESPTGPFAATGLEVHTPGRHPLKRSTIVLP